VIDLTTETPIPLADAAKLIPAARRGKKTHISTLLRWIIRGCRAPSGEVVRLDGLRLGDRWMTSAAALQRFAERLTPRLDDSGGTDELRSTTRRQKASEKAAAELKKHGI
jgi:Protein of unknown function (DUF1580)